MTVQELLEVLTKGMAENKFQPTTRVLFHDGFREGPLNIISCEMHRVIDASDDDANIILAKDNFLFNAIIDDIAHDEQKDRDKVLNECQLRIEECLILSTKSHML